MTPRLLLAASFAAAGCVANPVGRDGDQETDAAEAAAGGDDGGRPVPEADANEAPARPNARDAAGLDEPPDAATRPEPPDAAVPPGCEPAAPLRNPDSATFVEGNLYVQVDDGWVETLRLSNGEISRSPAGPAALIAGRPDHKGLARLRSIGPGAWVRLVSDVEGFGFLDVIDISDADGPRFRWRLDLGPNPEVFAVAAGRVHVCVNGQLAIVPIDGANEAPSSLEGPESKACEPSDGRAGDGTALITFTHGEGAQVPVFRLFLANGETLEQVVDHGFNPSGSHQYGDVVGAAIGPRRAIIDVQNTRNFFLLDLEHTAGWIYDAELDVGPSARMLGFVDDWLLFEEDARLRAYDLSDPLAPRAVPGDWPAATVEGAPHESEPALLFVSDDAFGVRGIDGYLGVYSRHSAQPWTWTPECPE